ncbi:hypothetical protein FKY96_13320 [Enterococcus faecalis]|nr:hypothetical protein [Enterococcus faecalis]NAN86546.1 hypothetical protein [Enterococcus faecalis]TQB32270.1 hypothetical protein FKY96_13320 [Enterococcus faecalis]TQB52339.1 hypothetical protein FKZ08_12875 [Enterococcus faecalis]TQB60228.1 hypothetical protein FKZ15_15065 [Enterococcus faecalis]
MKALNYSTSGPFLENENACYLVFLFFQQVNRQQKSGEHIHELYTFPAVPTFIQLIKTIHCKKLYLGQ